MGEKHKFKKLIIAEKPSVARNIADALGIKNRNNGYIEGDDYIITWVFGHLLQLYDAVDYDENMKNWELTKFPFIPDQFKYKVKTDKARKGIDAGAKKQLDIIKKLMERKDVHQVISATDWDREGQIIADELFLYMDVRKPIKRMLLNEWTKDEVLGALNSLRENEEMKNLMDAGFGRQLSDWLIGINLTSVATVKHKNAGGKELLNIGRVLMPTLKIIYDRDKEIEEFVSSKYYKMTAGFKARGEKFESTYAVRDAEGKWQESFDEKDKLDEFVKNFESKEMYVTKKDVDVKKENPPLLFNLSNLQGHITAKYKGWTADKVLAVAQNLYEKKLITYPRTASSALDESLKDKMKRVLDAHKRGKSFENIVAFKDSKRIFDNKKVESHSAITPTYILPKNLTSDEKAVYDAVVNRFLAQFMPQSVSEETRLEIGLKNCDWTFIARGKVQIEEGFRLAEGIASRDNVLPQIDISQIVDLQTMEIKEIKRKPPKHHSEKTLLKVMETCGKNISDEEEMMMSVLSGYSIGTPATRGETIRKLKDVGYIISDKKSLKTTELGKMMVETFPVKELFDLEYTGRLEKNLSDIERGNFKRDEFLKFIEEFIRKSVEDIKSDKVFAGKIYVEDEEKVVGICPNCKNKILEYDKSFGCSNWKNGCNFTIWKNDKFIEQLGKKVTRDMVELLLKNKRVGFRRLQGKNGNVFGAYLHYERDEKNNRYSWRLEFIK